MAKSLRNGRIARGGKYRYIRDPKKGRERSEKQGYRRDSIPDRKWVEMGKLTANDKSRSADQGARSRLDDAECPMGGIIANSSGPARWGGNLVEWGL